MKLDNKKGLIPRPSSEIIGDGHRKSPVIKRMTRDVLAQVEAHGLGRARFRIGDYNLREPDYRQILDWANVWGIAPEEVLEHFSAFNEPNKYKDKIWWAIRTGFTYTELNPQCVIEDGAIVSLHCAFGYPHILPNTWQDGLQVRNVHLQNCGENFSSTNARADWLPKLSSLSLGANTLKFDLSLVPALSTLVWSGSYGAGCIYRHTTEDLDLAPLPRLTKLQVNGSLTKLNLSPVPELTVLHIERNKLEELDLSPVPRLTSLNCADNFISQLNLSFSPDLTHLMCSNNSITDLDISQVPNLIQLNCRDNPITELDLSSVPNMQVLYCDPTIKLFNVPVGLVLK